MIAGILAAARNKKAHGLLTEKIAILFTIDIFLAI